jgi:DNA gyrase subunit B
MTDADVDGSHILTLLLTFFFRQMMELIERGYLYIAQPPLYKIKRGRKEQYLKNEAALHSYLLEEGTDEMTLKLGLDERIYRGKQIIPILNTLFDYDSLFTKVVKKGINEQLLRMFLKCGIKNGMEEMAELVTHLPKLKEAFPDIDYHAQEESILFSFGNIRVRVDGQVFAIINSYEYGLLAESFKRVNLLVGTAPALVFAEEKKLFETNRQEEILPFFMDTAKKGLYIQRYKGLGEMNPEQLWETTMHQENRVLLQVKIEDAVAAEEIFTVLMGDQVEPRRDFIEQNALNVSNLDI